MGNRDDTYPMDIERRQRPTRRWTLQTITAGVSVAATIIAGGWSVASLVQARLNDMLDRIALQQQELLLAKERLGNAIVEISKLQAMGPRFTAVDGDKLAGRLDRIETRVANVEARLAVIEDRGARK